MLEHVALNQTGFKIPGVAPDARGVLLGKQGAVLLSSLDRLVGCFRLLSEESPLDDILPSLKIWEIQSRLEARAFLVLFQAGSSYLLDRCARVAALCGGLLCTGSGKHFVKYRDRRSPLGYDADGLYGDPADFVLYTESFTQGYFREKEISFVQLALDLSLRPLPGGAARDIAELSERDTLWLSVRRGLGAKVLTYLWRNRVKMAAALVAHDDGEPDPARRSLLAAGRPDYYLVRIHDLPERMLRLLSAVPGIEAYAPAVDNVLVELGYRHPLRLTSCTSAFAPERLHLFSGARDRCEVLPAPTLLPGESLIQTRFELASRAGRVIERRSPVPSPEPMQVRLRLCPSAGGPRRAKATLVPWRRVPWFKQLVYALPPTLLREYRAAPLEEGVFVVSPRGIDVLPVGDLYQEIAPSIFVPAGMELLPRIGPEVLTEHVGGVAGRYVLLLPTTDPSGELHVLSLPHGAFDALGRRALAPLRVTPRDRLPEMPRPRAAAEVTLVNDPLGALPMWGFSDESGE